MKLKKISFDQKIEKIYVNILGIKSLEIQTIK